MNEKIEFVWISYNKLSTGLRLLGSSSRGDASLAPEVHPRDEPVAGRAPAAPCGAGRAAAGHGERSRLQLLFKLGSAENLSILAVNALAVNVLAVNTVS